MFIHFQNWSEKPQLTKLEEDDKPHGGHAIKAYATEFDPRLAGHLVQPGLVVIEGNGVVFDADETFAYPEGQFTGKDVESELNKHRLGQLARSCARTLFRFSHEHGLTADAMRAQFNRGGKIIDHPIEVLDGLERAYLPRRQAAMHLDIFLPDSLSRLVEVVDFRDPGVVLNARQGTRFLTTRHPIAA